jgi:hypothetical protein
MASAATLTEAKEFSLCADYCIAKKVGFFCVSRDLGDYL